MTDPAPTDGGMPEKVWLYPSALPDRPHRLIAVEHEAHAPNTIPYHDATACAERIEGLRREIEAVDGDLMTDGVCRAEHGPCGDEFNAPCSWCEFKASILALLDNLDSRKAHTPKDGDA